MLTTRLLLLVTLLGPLCFYSCGDDKKPTGGGSGSKGFANAVGMLWVYEVYDSLTATTDTVVVSVTDSIESETDEIFLRRRLHWNGSNRDSVLYTYTSVDRDTVDFRSESRPQPVLLERFVFPLTLGSEWTGDEEGDTSRVTEVGTVPVSAWSFSAAALVERSWSRDIEGGGNWSQTWVAQYFGIVSRHLFSQFSDGASLTVTVNQTWQLIRLDLHTFSRESFPDKVGNWWVYEMIDSLSDLVDTVTVTIVAEVEVSWGDAGRMWQYIGREMADTFYVGTVGDNLFVSPDPKVLYIDSWYYEFPLAVGRHWGSATPDAFPEVVGKGAITVLAGKFPSTFHYRMSGGAFNDYWTVDHWLVPGVGMVIGKHTRFGLGPMFMQNWNLISYKAP